LSLRYSALYSLKKPPKRIPKTLQNWLQNNGCWHKDSNLSAGAGDHGSGNPGDNEGEDSNVNASDVSTVNEHSSSNERPGGVIDDKEALFVTHVEDLIAVRQSPKVAIREFFDDLVVRHCDGVFRFLRKTPPGRTDHWFDGKILVSNEELVNRCSVLFEFLVALVLFITPLWILQAVNSANEKLAVITVFVLACLALLSFAMSGSPFQVLAATAGYASKSDLGTVLLADRIADTQLFSSCSCSQLTILLCRIAGTKSGCYRNIA
jgi:hypothetical protein